VDVHRDTRAETWDSRELIVKKDREQVETRRIFLEDMACKIAGIGLAMLPRTALSAQDKKPELLASVKISENRELEKVGGYLILRNTAEGDIMVVRSGAGEFSAFSNVCPHRQCLVEVKGPALIRCPCHQSAFKIDGTYISGPAKTGLRRFPIRVEGDSIEVLDN
jgi:Rieske Fe-S protein